MAIRPVFIPGCGATLVEEHSFEFTWAPGFSTAQKQKNIAALHREAKRHGIGRILEISSKSDKEVGQRLSAFGLKLRIGAGKFPLESIYQGSKVFEKGGPFTHLYALSPKESKRYIRTQDFGNLTKFQLEEKTYPLSPKNAFYDWLYIRSLEEHADWIRRNVKYDAFSDIEFNPSKQVNCQARAFAEYLSLIEKQKLKEAAGNFDCFAEMLRPI